MSITELIEQLKAMPEKMEGCNSEGEIGVINTHKLAEELKKSLRNCDVGTAEEQSERYEKFCYAHRSREKGCGGCPLCDIVCCGFAWLQMPYESEVKNGN